MMGALAWRVDEVKSARSWPHEVWPHRVLARLGSGRSESAGVQGKKRGEAADAAGAFPIGSKQHRLPRASSEFLVSCRVSGDYPGPRFPRACPHSFREISSSRKGVDARRSAQTDTLRYRQALQRRRCPLPARPEVTQSRSPAAPQPLAVALATTGGLQHDGTTRPWVMKFHENYVDRL
jgi:hypothetical protein